MTADEIRDAFGWNSVMKTGQSGYPDTDKVEVARLAIMAMGELAAQLAEAKERKGDISKMKLDAKFYGEIRKVKDDSIVPEDEYVVFLAKDNAFFKVLPEYRAHCWAMGCDAEQLDAVDRMIKRAEHWRAQHPERLKNPDAAGEKLLG